MTFGVNERSVEVIDPIGVTKGDRVEIGIKPARVVWASTIMYLIPVAAMIAGAVLGIHLAPQGRDDEGAALGSFLALALSFGGIWLSDKLSGTRDAQLPVILRVLGLGEGEALQTGDMTTEDLGR